MREAIADRELIVLDGLGTQMLGTLHRPADWRADTSVPARPGVLFLNSLSLPRAASGDSAVHWAASIAAEGYPACRVDLPGVGDTAGSSSTELLDFINGGGFTTAATAAIEELVERYNLTGVVLFGHCAGSVSAIYAAAASKNCSGLILLDPYFHLPQARRPKVREGLSTWARRSALGGLMSGLYDRARKLLLMLRGSQPPGNANTELLARWKQVASTGVPILLLKAPGIKAQGAKPRVGEFDYIDYVVQLAGRKSCATVKFVESADHSFANREGHAAVQMHIDKWLAAHFPLDAVEAVQPGAGPLRVGESDITNHDSNAVPADRVCALEGR
jgi:pimeloyl-ACP methyl ester carboxylesterase